MLAPILDRPPPTSPSAARRDRPFVLAVAAAAGRHARLGQYF